MTDQNVVLITGASSGIGYATAVAFARKGWNVAGTARRSDRLEALKQEIDSLPGDFLAVSADVRDAEAMRQAVQQVIDRFGRLDVMVANAGLGQRGALVESNWEDIETLLRTNIDGLLHTVRASVPVMRSGGQVVLISSVAYNLTSPYAATYAASKAFVSSIARSLSFELEARGITVTDMLVGRTQTEFDEKRLGAGKRTGGGKLPVMSSEQVAEAIIKAVDKKQREVTIRWIDRIIVLANVVAPRLIGRRALRQYK